MKVFLFMLLFLVVSTSSGHHKNVDVLHNMTELTAKIYADTIEIKEILSDPDCEF